MLSPIGMFTSMVKLFMTLHLNSNVLLVNFLLFLYHIYYTQLSLRLSHHDPHSSHRVHCELGQQCEHWLCGHLHLLYGTETLLHGKSEAVSVLLRYYEHLVW